MIPRVPFRKWSDLQRQADQVLSVYHPTLEIPVPIEEIIESGFRLEIIPVRGYRQGTGVEGGLSADLTNITVDEWVMQSRENRYRFTLAHELAHLILHREQIEALKPDDTADWKALIQSVAPKDYSMMEFQANALAGLILVPTEHLLQEYQSASARARARGIDLAELSDFGLEHVAEWTAEAFKVSGQVVSIRLKHALRPENDSTPAGDGTD